MEEPAFDEKAAWSAHRQCPRCRYPMARSLEACPSCSRPARLFSPLGGRLLWQRSRQLMRNLLALLQVVALLLAGLTLAYYLSPLLLLFPLVALSQEPPASRGGKTISHGKPRARS